MQLFSEPIPSISTQRQSVRWLLKADPRLKLLGCFALILLSITARQLYFPAILIGLCVYFTWALKVSFKTFLLRFSEPLLICLVLFILKVFFPGPASTGPEATALWQAGPFHIVFSPEGLKEAIPICFRILSCVSLVSVLGFSTTFTEIIAALSWFRIPETFIEICLYAYRFIFLLMEEAIRIYQAQKNRLGYSNFKRSLFSLAGLSGSLLLRAFEQSQSITAAMVQRGYNGSLPMFYHKSFSKKEVAGFASFLFVSGIIWIL